MASGMSEMKGKMLHHWQKKKKDKPVYEYLYVNNPLLTLFSSFFIFILCVLTSVCNTTQFDLQLDI